MQYKGVGGRGITMHAVRRAADPRRLGTKTSLSRTSRFTCYEDRSEKTKYLLLHLKYKSLQSKKSHLKVVRVELSVRISSCPR